MPHRLLGQCGSLWCSKCPLEHANYTMPNLQHVNMETTVFLYALHNFLLKNKCQQLNQLDADPATLATTQLHGIGFMVLIFPLKQASVFSPDGEDQDWFDSVLRHSPSHTRIFQGGAPPSVSAQRLPNCGDLSDTSRAAGGKLANTSFN